ncbi:Endonuclease V [Balamuthia mandrillaris]
MRGPKGGGQKKSELPTPTRQLRERWKQEQLALKRKLVLEDTFDWSLEDGRDGRPPLSLVGGVDISFIKDDPVNACASLVVLSYPQLKVVYKDFQMVELRQPYIAGFLAFREVPHLVPLFDKLRRTSPELVPQLVFVDGNGILHPRGFGLACHLGVLTDIPMIGVGKTFLFVDGMELKDVKRRFRQHCHKAGQAVELVGKSGASWGAALRSTDDTTSPIFVSPGHRVSLETALQLSIACCKFRIPEPVRKADLLSRDYIRQLSVSPSSSVAAAGSSSAASSSSHTSATSSSSSSPVSSSSLTSTPPVSSFSVAPSAGGASRTWASIVSRDQKNKAGASVADPYAIPSGIADLAATPAWAALASPAPFK